VQSPADRFFSLLLVAMGCWQRAIQGLSRIIRFSSVQHERCWGEEATGMVPKSDYRAHGKNLKIECQIWLSVHLLSEIRRPALRSLEKIWGMVTDQVNKTGSTPEMCGSRFVFELISQAAQYEIYGRKYWTFLGRGNPCCRHLDPRINWKHP
jgi:hypothetical protein